MMMASSRLQRTDNPGCSQLGMITATATQLIVNELAMLIYTHIIQKPYATQFSFHADNNSSSLLTEFFNVDSVFFFFNIVMHALASNCVFSFADLSCLYMKILHSSILFLLVPSKISLLSKKVFALSSDSNEALLIVGAFVRLMREHKWN